MSASRTRLRQLVDGRAAVLAGLAAGLTLLALEMFLTARVVGSPWAFVRYLAAVLLGPRVLPPPSGFDAGILLAALAVHLPLSILRGWIIAFVIHRGGLLTGILGGAALGLALYAIDVWTVSLFFPWFSALQGAATLWSHVAFGAVAGGVYELLEVERFVKVEG